jgi:S1-C subfamily serine protease
MSHSMIKKLILLFSIVTATLLTGPAQADPTDISAASRSVVRVVLAAKDGNKVAFVGHGSGFVVAPDKIVTNAHVVEIARQESSLLRAAPAMAEKSSLIHRAMILRSFRCWMADDCHR